MSNNSPTIPGRTSTGLELLRLAGLLGILAIQLVLGSRIGKAPATYCFTKPIWLDEFNTVEVCKQEHLEGVVRKLSQGGDTNLPGLHVTLWLMSQVVDVSDELLLRGFSFAVGLVGLTASYFLLRLRFPWFVSWVAVMGMWSSTPLLVKEMFDGRFYSFWFAAVAVLCLLLSVRARGVWQPICVAFVAALVCVIHYFGIIAVGLIAVSQFLCNLRDARQRWPISAALIGAGASLIVSIPMYMGQKVAYPVSSWLEPPNLHECLNFINGYILTYALTFPVLAYALQRLLGWDSGVGSSETEVDFKVYAGTCGMILLPVALTVFSYLVQPAYLERYAIPALLAYAPLIALLSSKLRQSMLAGMALLFFVIGVRSAALVYKSNPDFRDAAPIVAAASTERPLVVHSRHDAYPLFWYADINPRIVRISYEFRGDKLTRFDAFEQAAAHTMAGLFELPGTIEADELASLDEFYLLAKTGEEQRYEGWTAEPLGILQGRHTSTLGMYHLKRAR